MYDKPGKIVGFMQNITMIDYEQFIDAVLGLICFSLSSEA